MLLLLLIGWAHTEMSWDGDAIWFLQMGEFSPAWAYDRYLHWSSRFMIELPYVLFLKYLGLWTWRIMDTCVMWLCCRLLVYFACPQHRQAFGMWCMLPVAGLFPLFILRTAGWSATMVNYLWPGTALLVALIPWKRLWHGEHVPTWMQVLSFLSLLVALDVEQTWMIFFGLWWMAIWQMHKVPSARWLLFIQGALLFLFGAIIFLCPGNVLRKEAAIYGCWPDFLSASLLDKMVLSLNNMGRFFLSHELLMLLFTAVLAVMVVQRCHGMLERIVGCLPFALKMGTMLFALHRSWGILWERKPQTMFDFFELFGLPQRQIVTPLTASHVSAYLPMGESLLFFVSIGLAIYLIFGHTRKSCRVVFLYLLGCASSFSLALSPTLFASSYRIFFFQYLALIVILLVCLSEWREQRRGW